MTARAGDALSHTNFQRRPSANSGEPSAMHLPLAATADIRAPAAAPWVSRVFA